MLWNLLRNAIKFTPEHGDVVLSCEAGNEQHYDLCISDLALPDGTGYDLMRELAERRIAGIAISGFGTAEDIERSGQAGFREHLVKPVDFEELCAAIGRAVR